MGKRFDFNHFDKVIGRAFGGYWRNDFYCYYDYDDETNDCSHICMGGAYDECVPYEGNEHLIGTTDEFVEPKWKQEEDEK